MKIQRLGEDGHRTYALVLETGEAVMEYLGGFAEHEQLNAASLTAIGAFSDATLAWFDWEAKEYREIPVQDQIEVLTLAGDVALGPDGDPSVHVHVICGRRDGSTVGGHLLEAHVRPTLEVMLREEPGHLRKRIDPESGLPLIATGSGPAS